MHLVLVVKVPRQSVVADPRAQAEGQFGQQRTKGFLQGDPYWIHMIQWADDDRKPGLLGASQIGEEGDDGAD